MIYVDQLMFWPEKKSKWCHLLSDESAEELHAFAKKIGMQRKWFQDKSLPHYDLAPSFREKAVNAGAIELKTNIDLSIILKKVRLWSKSAGK